MKKIFYYFIILISLITYFYAGYTLDKLKQFENIVDISFLENKPNEDFIKNVLQKKQGVKDIIALSNEGEVDILFNNKYEKTKLVKVFGNPKKIFPKENVLYKPYFEKNGVYISNNLAYNTFNKQDIIGSKIFINDKEYIICGIFEDKTSKVIINSNKYDEFDNIKVFFNKTNNIVKDINNFTKLNNSENLHIININKKINILDFILQIPKILLLVLTVYTFHKVFNFDNKFRIRAIFYQLFGVAGIIILYFILKINIYIPFSFTLDKLSNIDFYKNLVIDTYNNIKNYFYVDKSLIFINISEDIVIIILNLLVCICGIIYIFKKICKRKRV